MNEEERARYKDLAEQDKIRFREEFEQFEKEWPEEALALEQKKAERKMKRQSKSGNEPKARKQNTKAAKDAPKARSAYIIYSVTMRDSVKAENQGISFGEIAKKIAAMWKSLPEKEKSTFHEQAKAEKAKLEEAGASKLDEDDVSTCKSDEPDTDGFSSRMTLPHRWGQPEGLRVLPRDAPPGRV